MKKHSAKQLYNDPPDQPLETQSPLAPDEIGAVLADVQRLAGIGTLATSIAQELANILGIITAASEGLRDQLQEPPSAPQESVQHYLDLIERNAFRGAQIVTLLQEYGSLQPPQMAITDIGTILRDALVLVEGQFREESNVRIMVSAPDASRTIVCDHNRIVHLLVNLLNNTRQEMDDGGGCIDIEVREVQAGTQGQDRLQRGSEYIAIAIRNNGTGPEVQEMDEIVVSTASPRPNGTGAGLGMSIAQDIVDQHNGTIWINNEENSGPSSGATVTVILPVRPSSWGVR